MVTVKMTMRVLPEKQLEVMQTLLSMIDPAEKEVECLGFSVFCDIEDKNCFSLLGEWKTREALDLHVNSQRFSVLLGTKALLSEPMQVQIHTVSHSEGMEAIHTMRDKRS